MIPIKKLKNLPIPQGKLKTAKIFDEAERGFLDGSVTAQDFLYLAEILDYWIERIPAKQADALDSVRKNLMQTGGGSNAPDIRRELNTAKYIFLGESGRFPSEWDFDATDAEGRLDPSKRRIFYGMKIYLEDIRSPFNVGAMFRTAESFGAEKIFLSPFCADPNHRRAQRTAMGCTEILPWSRLEENPFAENSALQEDFSGLESDPETKFFALETGGTRLEDFRFPQNGIMIAGSEELGVSPQALAAADTSAGRVSIPVYGAKGSLNVSVAFGIAMHAWAVSLKK